MSLDTDCCRTVQIVSDESSFNWQLRKPALLLYVRERVPRTEYAPSPDLELTQISLSSLRAGNSSSEAKGSWTWPFTAESDKIGAVDGPVGTTLLDKCKLICEPLLKEPVNLKEIVQSCCNVCGESSLLSTMLFPLERNEWSSPCISVVLKPLVSWF